MTLDLPDWVLFLYLFAEACFGDSNPACSVASPADFPKDRTSEDIRAWQLGRSITKQICVFLRQAHWGCAWNDNQLSVQETSFMENCRA